MKYLFIFAKHTTFAPDFFGLILPVNSLSIPYQLRKIYVTYT